MTIYELMDDQNCTTEERRQVMAYYIALKLLPNLDIIVFLAKRAQII